MATSFLLTVNVCIFFRVENLTHAIEYISAIFSPILFTIPEIFSGNLMFVILLFTTIEWVQREKQYALQAGTSRMLLSSQFISFLTMAKYFYISNNFIKRKRQ